MMMTKKSPPPDDEFIKPLMNLALSEAKLAIEHGDVPVGAVVARRDSGLVIAHTHNQKERDNDPTAHAEILALRQAASVLGSWRLSECLLVQAQAGGELLTDFFSDKRSQA